ncbi:MAG: YggS family pyridoxal phosphate-dependent enzyme [Gammaproteobacteria bacterium]|nr:YggS family pyridoxal phosphate-dependent enzyme [Gammaproteobacteria bacterium]
MQTLADRFNSIQERIRKTEIRSNRPAGSVQLLAVSKKKSIDVIQAAFELGQVNFGENYLQEALPKIAALRHLPIHWHFIGQLQTNKTKLVSENFDWAHSVDRYKIAQRLNDQRPLEFEPLNICIQVNLDDEQSKAGISPDAVLELADAITGLPRLHLRGLMALPRPLSDQQQQRETFRRLCRIQETLIANGLVLDTLSMGMSDDFEAAIAEGSTIIRIGTALFGPRE